MRKTRVVFGNFACLCVAGLIPLLPMPATAASCLDRAEVTPARIDYVVDGDTVSLRGGKRVRIIGLNAPEIERPANAKRAGQNKQAGSARSKGYKASKKASNAGALAARLYLHKLLHKNKDSIGLVWGLESRDRHGRMLAHLLIPGPEGNRQLVAKHMISAGWALASAVAPNTRCADYLGSQESNARINKKGLWGLIDSSPPGKLPWVVKSRKLKARETGFYLIRDRIDRVQQNNSGHRLLLQHGLVVTLPDKGSKANAELKQLTAGSWIEVRGWVSRSQRRHWLKLQHWSNIQLSQPSQNRD